MITGEKKMSLPLAARKWIQIAQKPFAKEAKQAGMSLIEIILVISLMATLMGILISNLTDRQDEAMKDAAKLSMQQLSQKLQEYRIHNYRYPTTDQGLSALITNPGSKRWRGPYTEKSKLVDPWDGEFGYESDGRNIKIISAGPDGQLGSEDDISFPEEETEEGGSDS